MAKNIIVLIRKIYRGIERRKRGGNALFPFPLPDGIYVRVANEVQFFHFSTLILTVFIPLRFTPFSSGI